jgi:hypothetical protein
MVRQPLTIVHLNEPRVKKNKTKSKNKYTSIPHQQKITKRPNKK